MVGYEFQRNAFEEGTIHETLEQEINQLQIEECS